MKKSSHFFGQSVFGQLISLIDRSIVETSVQKHHSDRYVKKFDTFDHLISMLFCSFSHCPSLLEVAAAMLGLKGKTSHFQLKSIPYGSTLGDANQRRSHRVFEVVYYGLLRQHAGVLSDSRQRHCWKDELDIIDSSTVSLFKDILSRVGRKPSNGQRKGGIKVHTQINLQQKVPKLIWFTAAATHDRQFLKRVKLGKGKIAVFDRGYNDYSVFDDFTRDRIFFLTRLKTNAAYEGVSENDIPVYIDV